MKTGGFDPSILRELSGGYKPFVKAVKELVSNAFDADAEVVDVRLNTSFDLVEITDDGVGMTPFEFRDQFTRIGGSTKRSDANPTDKGRLRIGSKGIGFLAVARYCGAMEIVSSTRRVHRVKLRRRLTGQTVDVGSELSLPLSSKLLHGRLRVSSVSLIAGRKTERLSRSEYELLSNCHIRLLINARRRRKADSVAIHFSLDCRDLEFKATIDYDYLLDLENNADLSRLEDFCKIEIYPLPQSDERIGQQYTKIRLIRLRSFVMRELKAPKKSGRVRNVESASGLDQFIWHLSRCTPIKYHLPQSLRSAFGRNNLESSRLKSISRLVVHSPEHGETELKRHLWSGNSEIGWDPSDNPAMTIAIDRGGLQARGYVVSHTEPIFPAEFRGIAVRVRNVQIGVPTFFGIEHVVTGATRGMLSQITGEMNVFQGLDATDALNPGRDSFYEENTHYKILKEELVGSGESLGGLLGRLVNQMLEKQLVVSSVESALTRANHYRNALLNLSMAINHYGSNGAVDMRRFFRSAASSNGLGHRKDYDTAPGPRMAGFRVLLEPNLSHDYVIDFNEKTIRLDLDHDRWNHRIFVLGQHYAVIPKDGLKNDPLCEIDTIGKRIYVNWGHPLRQDLGDAAFLRSAVAWKLSYLVSSGDIEAMMDLALKLLTFNGA